MLKNELEKSGLKTQNRRRYQMWDLHASHSLLFMYLLSSHILVNSSGSRSPEFSMLFNTRYKSAVGKKTER